MKALTLVQYGELVYREEPEPPLQPCCVRIAVEACGICGSDIHGMDGSTGRRIPPIIMGHEAAGVVVELGDGVSDWQVGDRVTFDSTVYCNACDWCRGGNVNLCENRRVLGVSCDEYRQHGAFAECVVVPQHILYRLPENVSFVQASLAEPLSIALHAASHAAPLEGKRALVAGAGMIGLLVVQVLKAHGCSHVTALELDAGRRTLALELGADEAVGALAGPASYDASFEVVGITETVRACVESTRKGGDVVLVGNLSPEVALPLQRVVTRELHLHGSCASAGEYGAGLDLIAAGKVNVDALVSAVAPLSEGAAWFDRQHGKERGLLKVVLEPGASVS